MAIKIQGTEVVGDTHRNLKNITNTQGSYSYVDRGTLVQTTNPSAGSNIQIDLDYDGRIAYDYMSSCELGGAVTWNMPNSLGVEPGKVITIFVDSSSNGYDQTFSWSGTGAGTIRYPEDTEPDWTLARYWMHQITVWNSSEISIVSTSWAS